MCCSDAYQMRCSRLQHTCTPSTPHVENLQKACKPHTQAPLGHYMLPRFQAPTAAKWRSPSSGMGSSQGRDKSLGMASSSVRCCCCCSSRRSFDKALCQCKQEKGWSVAQHSAAQECVSVTCRKSTDQRLACVRSFPRTLSFIAHAQQCGCVHVC